MAASSCSVEVPLAADLSVAEVRRALASLRKGWDEVLVDPSHRPLYLSNSLDFATSCGGSVSLEDFALRFVLAHHQKRQNGMASSQ